MLNKRIFIFFLLIFTGLGLKAQTGILAYDAETGDPLTELTALVKYTSPQGKKISEWKFSDKEGRFYVNHIGVLHLTLSQPGYQTYVDSIEIVNNNEFRIGLKKLSKDLGEVVVTGQFEITAEDKTIQKVRIIDQERIQAQGAVSLADVLSNELNIRINRDNVLGTSINLQGISGQNIKILIDGIPVIGRLDGNVDLSQINLNRIERIEIIEGPMSVIYGSDALGGVINLITKKEVKNKVEFDANSLVESPGTFNSDSRLAFKIKNVKVQTNIGRNFFNGYSTTGETRAFDWKPREQYFSDLNVAFRIKNSLHRVQIDYFDEEMRSLGRPVITQTAAYAMDNYFFTTRYGASIFNDFKFKNGATLNLITNYSHFNRSNILFRKNLVSLQNRQVTDGSGDTTTFDYYMFRATYTTNRQNKKWNYQFGVDQNFEEGSGNRLLNNYQNISDYALFGSFEFKTNRIQLRGGLRAAENSRYNAPIVPSVNFKYQINTNNLVRFSYARGFRAPSLKELNLFFVDVNHNIQGNPDLNAENSNNFNLNYSFSDSYKKSKFKFDVSLFYNEIFNMISLAVVDPRTQLYKYVNINEFKSTGFNLNFDFKVDNFSFNSGFAYTYRLNNITNTFIASPEARSQISYKIPIIETSVNLFFKFNGAVPGFVNNEDGTISETFVQAYSMSDLSLSKTFWDKKVSLIAGVKNLFNVTNIQFNMAGGGAHSGSGNMAIGMGRLVFTSLRISLY